MAYHLGFFLMFKRITAAIIFGACLSAVTHASNLNQISKTNANHVYFDLIDTRTLEGSLGTVESIIQDKYGFIWMASDRGLTRYDGHRFRTYTSGTNPNDIAGTIIQDLMLDGDKQLWIASTQGLSRYREKTDDFENFNDDPDLNNTHLSSIAWGFSNRILVGTYEGLKIVNIKTREVQIFRSNPSDPTTINSDEINDIFIDSSQNTAWISTRNGASELNLDTLGIKRHLADQHIDDFLNNSRCCQAELNNITFLSEFFGCFSL